MYILAVLALVALYLVYGTEETFMGYEGYKKNKKATTKGECMSNCQRAQSKSCRNAQKFAKMSQLYLKRAQEKKGRCDALVKSTDGARDCKDRCQKRRDKYVEKYNRTHGGGVHRNRN